MSHFPTSQQTTDSYPKLGCSQFSLQKLQMLTTVYSDTDNTNNAATDDDADD